MFVTTEITIDFQRPRQNTMQVVQDDTTRKIRLILKNGGNDYDITSDLGSEETWVGAVAYLKPDGHGGVYDTTEDGEKAVQLVSGTTNQFDVLLVGQVFTAAGWTQVNIKFYNSDFSKVLSTFAIEVNVQKNAASDYESEDYSNMQSLGAIRAEMVAFEATVRDELAAFRDDPDFGSITLRDTYGGVTIYGGYGGAENKPVINLTDTGDGDLPVRIVNVSAPQQALDAANKQYVDAKAGLSETAKQALLNCFVHVAWADEHGQDYYDALEAALYPPTDLVSISAVFNQGQTVVYDTDSLDVLIPMLTVTAHYSDSTTETITAYTLSGTLTVGTSTITVGYGGKTTTFDVTVTANPVPAEYQRVEWVGSQSDDPSDSGPYILTNISESDKASLNGYSITITAICDVPVQAEGNVNGMMIGFASKYGTYFGSVKTGKMAINLSPELNVNCSEKNTYNLSFSATGLTVTSGTESVYRDYSTSTFAPRLWIGTGFAQANVSTLLRIYDHVAVEKNGVLVGEFYPCYRKSDNAIGFYDSVSDSFFTNASASGTFQKGDNI